MYVVGEGEFQGKFQKKWHYFINADRLVEIDRGDNNITDRNVRYYSLTWTNKYSNPESKNYHPHFGS